MIGVDEPTRHWPKPDDVQDVENAPGVVGGELQPRFGNAQKISRLVQEAARLRLDGRAVHRVIVRLTAG